MRLSIAGMLLLQLVSAQAGGLSSWRLVTAGSIGMLVCLGVFTPIAAILCISIEVTDAIGLRGESALHALPAVLITGALGLLGPGAFSLDAKWFGRRLVVLSRD